MTGPDLEHPATVESLDALDVIEAGEVFEFIAGWLAAAGPAVAANLARVLDPGVYPLAALVADCRRLAAVFAAERDR
jgi:hypothetical protein